MLLRAAVNEGEGKKPESSRASPTRYFLRYYISGIRNVLVQTVLRTNAYFISALYGNNDGKGYATNKSGGHNGKVPL